MSDALLWERAAQACVATAESLKRAGVPTEALAELVPERRQFFVFKRAATMHPLGEVWRIGSLLLRTDGQLFSLGRITRAAVRGRVGYQSLSREARRDIAAAALRGGYPVGTPVNFDALELPLPSEVTSGFDESSPIGLDSGEVRVRWRSGASLSGAPTLEQHLAERADLLINPPFSRD